MFLKKGTSGRILGPASGTEFTKTINLGKKVNNLYIVLNGFELQFESGAHPVSHSVVDLQVTHTNGSDTAVVRFKLRLASNSVWGGSFYGKCDYVLIGQLADTRSFSQTTKAKKAAPKKK